MYNKIPTTIINLFICMEAIDIYLLHNTKEEIIYDKYYLYKKINKLNTYQTQALIVNINFLFNKIQTYHIQELSTDLLQNYVTDINYIPMTQYIKRFKFLYKKTQNYYYSLSHSSNMHIQDLAITNLYVISKMNEQKSLYNFMEYLQSTSQS